MKKLLTYLLVTTALVAGGQDAYAKDNNTINVATFNLRLDTPDDGLDAWTYRKKMVQGLIRFHDLDIVGTQEGYLHQLQDIIAPGGYDFVGIGREDGIHGGEHSAIVFKTDRFQVLDQGDFWLSTTPHIPSLGWDAKIKRICSWAKFYDNVNETQLFVFSVHFDHIAAIARKESAKLMIQQVKAIAGSTTFFCVGDFNATPESEPMQIMLNDSSFHDAKSISNTPPYGTNSTFHDFNVNAPKEDRIDYIFVSDNVKVNKYGTLNDVQYGYFPSDHYPVMIQATLPTPFSPVDYVNPLMGTASTYELSAGNTYPAIARPWGMNAWTPQTGQMGHGWTYVYTANKIKGFRQTHQPSPWINDYGQFAIMPITGTPVFEENKRESWFSHKAEISKPHYYQVYLADHDVLTEITPTERAAMFRFTFPETKDAYVIIDAFDKNSYVKIIPDKQRIIGYTTRNSGGVPKNFKNYFIIEFDKKFNSNAIYADGFLERNQLEQQAKHTGALVGFHTTKGEIIHAKVASSFISFEQAEINLKELGDDNFDTVVEKGRTAWNDALKRITVEGGSTDQYRTFYTCLYRTLLFPRAFHEYDANGNVYHYSPYNGEIRQGPLYTDTGFWDTFRALFPFLNLMFPSVNQQIQEGLVNAYKESGFFPEWASPGHRGCMVGNNSASVLVDAYIKGVKVNDLDTLYQGLLHGANNVHPTVKSVGRLGFEHYNKLGYVPSDVKINESAARTLEYAYNDWCIYTLAKKIGRPQKEINTFAKRALNYRNLYDKEHKLMRGRKADGTFATPFSPFKWGGDFTEGNSWHYTWSVFHDPQGLIDLMGGDQEFVTMLDSLFVLPPVFDESYYRGVIHEIREMTVMNMGNYAHGNQPIQHAIYLYNYAGMPWKAQHRLRMAMDRLYSPTPDGYCGDEDNGQTSAWYVFTALGFYPVCPGTDQYVLGSPLFKKATLHLENGETFVINAPGNSSENVYIKKATLNKQTFTRNYLTHQEILQGGELKLQMNDSPNTDRGTRQEDRPYSFSNEEK